MPFSLNELPCRPLGKGMKMAGRAVTVRFVPQRPDIAADKPPGVNSPEYEAFEKCGPKEVIEPRFTNLILPHFPSGVCTGFSPTPGIGYLGHFKEARHDIHPGTIGSEVPQTLTERAGRCSSCRAWARGSRSGATSSSSASSRNRPPH